MTGDPGVGLVLGSAIRPEDIQDSAATAEASGFDEIWLAEDFFFTGGISGASLVLGATSHITVGLGVVSAVARHPALLAMELSTLSRVHEERLIAGVGLGVPAWVRQMGLHPRSPLAALRECVTSVQALLRGDTLDTHGEVFDFNNVTLTYPETGTPTPVRMGVSGPKMLELSGEVADGSVLSVAAGIDYVNWARERIAEGRTKAGRSDEHPVTVFALYAVDDDGDAARDSARETLAFYRQNGPNGLTDVYGISEELSASSTRAVTTPWSMACRPNGWRISPFQEHPRSVRPRSPPFTPPERTRWRCFPSPPTGSATSSASPQTLCCQTCKALP